MPERPTATVKGDLVQSVQRACSLLAVLGQERRPLTPREFSDAVGINLTTCYHLLNTLEHEGLLQRDDERRYRLGHRVRELHEAFEAMLPFDEPLLALLEVLNLRTNETSYLGLWEGDDVFAAAVREGRGGVRVRGAYLGYRTHAYARALGRAMIAFRDDAFVDDYLRTTTLEPLTPHTVTNRRTLRTKFKEVRRLGYAVESEEFTEGVSCIAAPVFDAAGAVCAALSVSVPKARFDTDATDIIETVRAVAAEATEMLTAQRVTYSDK